MIFQKHLSEMTKDDIHNLIHEAVPEGAEVEYKKDLPTKGGPDVWITDGRKIGEKARNEIIEEVIAFANAHGGTLILGIQETEEKPARAEKIAPIPRCSELADRLRLQCRDCIDPQVPLLESVGIPIEDSGSGVVVIRVSQSRLAPHRHTQTLHCYIRRADRSEKMTMREIQDLTLQVERGIEQIEKKFIGKRERALEEFRVFSKGYSNSSMLRASLVPMIPLSLLHIYNNAAICRSLREINASIEDLDSSEHPFTATLPTCREQGNWRPILRGARGKFQHGGMILLQEITSDGTIDFILQEGHVGYDLFITPNWIINFIGNALCVADHFRKTAKAPEIEYGLEFEIFIAKEPIKIADYFSPNGSFGKFPHGSTLFPRYSVGNPEEFSELLSLLDQDFWNAAGLDYNHKLHIDFSFLIQT